MLEVGASTSARFSMYCATMLTAISGTLCERILIPTGQATRATSSTVAIFCFMKCSAMVRALRALPIIPRN